MATQLRSQELENLVRKVYNQGSSGHLSVIGDEEAGKVYGTLHFYEGELVKADYGTLQGQAALDAVAALPAPKVTFSGGAVENVGSSGLIPTEALLAPRTPKTSRSGGLKIFPQVLLTMFLVALVPLAGFWFINNVRVQQQMRASAEQNLRDASANLATKVDGWVDTNVRTLEQNASLPDVTSMQRQRQAPILQTMPAVYDWMYSAFVIDDEGFISARGDDEPIFNEDGTKMENRSDREYYTEAAAGSIGEQTIISSRTGKPAMCMSSPIDRKQQIVGVLATCSFLDSISEAVTGVKVGDTGFAILVDDKNNVIAHGDLTDLEDREELLNISDYPALAEGSLGEQDTFKLDGREVVTYTQETALGWKLIVQQDYADAFAAVLDARRNALFLLLATVLFVIIVASLMARRLVRPIESLTQVADDMSRGQLEADISETSRKDEIGALARAVERMGISIKMAFEELNHA